MRDATRHSIALGLWAGAGALAFWRRGYEVMGGNDLWWHLATGRWIVEHGSIPATDSWSFTAAGNRWVVDAWLSDLILHAWSELLGLQCLVFWKWAVLIATFLVLMRLAWRISGSPLLSYLVAVFAAAVATPYLDLRPQMHSLLCLAIFLECTVERDRPSFSLPILFVVWTNLHAGFALGLVLLPLVLLPGFLRRERRMRTLGLLCACVGACLLNPNGYRAITQPLIYALETDSPFQKISEWASPFGSHAIDAPLYPYALALFGAATLFQLIRLARKKPVPWVALLVGWTTAAMSLRSQKFISVFAICSSLLLIRTLAPLLRRLLQRVPSIPAAAVALVLGVVLLWPYPQRCYAFHYLASEYSLPIETVNFIEKNRLTGNVFAYYQWGGYLHYRMRGRLPVFVDGRASAVFDPETFRDYTTVSLMRPGWTEIVNRSGAEYVLWPVDDVARIKALLQSRVWRPVYGDAVSTLLVRANHALPEPLLPTEESAHKDLALGRAAGEDGRHDLALEHFTRARAKAPRDALACGLTAAAHAMNGDEEKGWDVVARCKRLFPGLVWDDGYRQTLENSSRRAR